MKISISRQEQQLADVINQLKPRKGWVELADLQVAIYNSKVELDQISRQLGEKRSLLDKLLGRNRGGSE